MASYKVLEIGGSVGDVGVVAAAFGFLSLFFAVPIGRWVDRGGEARYMLIGSALMSGRDVQEIEAWPDRIGEVTAAEVNEAARTLFRPEVTVTSELRPKPTS